MALLDAEDMAEIFDTDEAAVDAYYTPTGKNVKNIPVIFINEYSAVRFGYVDIDNATPLALAIRTDVDDAVPGEVIIINETTYYILRAEKPKGNLRAVLILSEDAP